MRGFSIFFDYWASGLLFSSLRNSLPKRCIVYISSTAATNRSNTHLLYTNSR